MDITTDRRVFEPIVISAPFGNYIQPDGMTATMGTFTASKRGGRTWQIIRTVRYYPRLRAWANKMGLRNPGIDWLVEKVRRGKVDVSDKIISIHGFTKDDWDRLLDRMSEIQPLAMELNISCPNIGEIHWPGGLFADAVSTDVRVVVKLPPVNYEDIVEQAVDGGVRMFHCCNTLPVPCGGISGAPLKPVVLQCIRDLRTKVIRQVERELTIIGGGGVMGVDDVDEYIDAGAHHVALGVKLFNPVYLFSTRSLDGMRDRAAKRLGEE